MSPAADQPRSHPANWRPGEGWGWTWGKDDQVGALNALTDSSRLTALRTIERGRMYDLGVAVDRSSYLASAHVGTEVVAYRTPSGLLQSLRETGAIAANDEVVSFNTSMVVISDHAGTQIDGLCHATRGTNHEWYNGFSDGVDGRDFGPAKAAAHNIPPIVVRAVLIDVPRALDLPELPASHPISVEELQTSLRRQKTVIHPGDAVFVRTGAMRHWGDSGADHESIRSPDSAGLTLAAARWLVEQQGAILVGADNSTVEVVPPVDGASMAPVHEYLLIEQGVHMGELHNLEELSADEIYEFCYVSLCPKVRGTTAGFALRPVALV